MSLLSVSSAEGDLVFVSNLDSSSTERVNKTGSTGTGTAYNTLTQESESLTGSYSYKFTTGAYIEHGSSLFGNTGEIGLEVVFRKSGSVTSGGECIVRRRGGNTIGDGAEIVLNADGTLTSFLKGYTGSSSSITSTTTYNDNKWHHVVLLWKQYNYFRVYVDGTLLGTASANIANVGGGYVILGANRSQSGSNSYSQYFSGSIDFFAAYSPVPNNTNAADTFVANHVAEFANRVISVDKMDATNAILVQPTVSIIRNVNVSADPSTASSLFVDPKVSNFDYPKTLLTYINSISPNYYIRFKDQNFTNEIAGTTDTWTILGTPTFKQIGNVSTEPSMVLNDEGNYNTHGDFRPQRVSGVNSAFFNNFDNDDVSLGFWIKTTASDVYIFQAFRLDIGGNYQLVPPMNYNLVIDATGKAKLTLGFDDDGTMVYEDLISGESVNNGAWHFIAFKFNGSTATLYLDGEEETVKTGLSTLGTRPEINLISFGGQSNNEWASLVQGPYSLLTGTRVSNIWSIGTANFQAQSFMVDPVVKISTGFYDKVDSYGPILNFKFDGSGVPISTVNPSYTTLGLASTFNSARVAYGVPSKNVNGYRVTDTVSNFNGILDAPSGTFTTDNEWSLSALVKVDSTKVGGTGGYYGENRQFAIVSGDGVGDIALGYSDTKWLAYASEQGYATELTIESTSSIDSNWHLLTATFDGTYFKLYVDGKQEASQDTSTYYADNPYTTADVGTLYIGGGENFYFQMGSTTDVDKLIDHVGIFDFALSATEAFELWQSVGIDPMVASNATFPLPVGVAGFGPTIHPGVMYVSALLVDPTQQDTVAPTILPMTAFATSVTPNFAATSTATIAADPATASALFHMPQFNIGENNSVDHMNASAVFMDPDVLIPGFWNANPMIATAGTFVDPAVVTTRGGLVLAQAMTASVSMVLPPAYKSLFDDKWYDLLYDQHSVRHGFRTANGGNGEAILKLFDDITVDKIIGNTISNNLTQTITTDGLVEGDTAPVMKIIGDFTPTTNAPLLGIGYFDDYQRKAVKFNNITTGYENSEYANVAFSFELSIKTTKANQIIAFGKTRSFFGSQQYTTSYGLSDGKLFLRSTGAIGPAPTLHYKETTSGNVLIGNKRIDDGQWHHIVIQNGWSDNRVQFWIDGELDRQKIGGFRLDGPSFLGFNSSISTYASDFQTSVWSYDSHAFPRELEIDNHRYAYIKYEPVRAEPMLATSKITEDTIAEGNRGRLLLLYWWQNRLGYNQFVNDKRAGITTGYDGNNSPFNPEDLIDDPGKGPLEWYGWDVFPVNVLKPTPSDIIKPDNIEDGNYINIDNAGQVRWLDLQKDLKLSQFDTIMFANYPTTSAQIDSYISSEYVDDYFNITEKNIYNDFLISLRKAVDDGMSLFVQFDQLARDLKIYEQSEIVPVFDEGISDERAFWHVGGNVKWDEVNNRPDAYLSKISTNPGYLTFNPDKSILPIDEDRGAYFYDWYDNQRHRVINTVEKLTDDPTYIMTDRAHYKHSEILDFGGSDRWYEKFEYKIQGLQNGDEFVFGNPNTINEFGNTRPWRGDFLAVPFDKIKAGRVITAQPEKYWKGNVYTDNPYKNYAHSIALLPGDVLDGKGIGGKIFVSISDVFWDESQEYRYVDLYFDYWIDTAYNLGLITESRKNELKDIQDNPAYVSTVGRTVENYNWSTYWSRNDQFAFTQVDKGQNFAGVLGLLFESTVDLEIVPRSRKALKSFTRNRDALGRFATGSGGSGALFVKLVSGRTTDTINVYVPNLITRGLWWLSERERPTGLVNRPAAMTATIGMPAAIPVVDKIISINAAPMISNAILADNITGSITITTKSITLPALPMTATAAVIPFGKNIIASVFSGSALVPEPSIFTYLLEEVILTVAHTDAIVYIKGDKIT
jgi:hypothetical protein